MIAIDTNVLVRIIVEDNDIQSRKALRYIEKHRYVFVSHIVICETGWVLESCYNLKKDELITVFENILRIEQLNVEHSDVVWSALNEFKQVSADFSDCLISVIAKNQGCTLVGTFDRKASKISNFDLIK